MQSRRHPLRASVPILLSLASAACTGGGGGGGTGLSAPAVTQIAFLSRTDLTVGVAATAVAAADVDGDGRPDLVVTRYQESKVTWFRSLGGGAFGPGVDLPAGPLFPMGVAAGDLDGDGLADVAVTDYVSGRVYAYRNTGGAFVPPVSEVTGAGPLSIAIGDLDGDGRADLTVACVDGVQLTVHRGNVGFSFLPAWQYPIGGIPILVALHDLDGDGRLDVLCTDTANAQLRLFQNLAAVPPPFFQFSEWAPGAAGPETLGLAIGDLDGDGPAEIVTGSATTSQVLVWKFAAGAVSPAGVVATPAPCAALALADFDGDGNLDLGAAHHSVNAASVWKGNGDTTFGPPSLRAAGRVPVFVAAADTSGDGRADFHVADADSREVAIYLGQSAAGAPVAAGPPAFLGAIDAKTLGAGDLDGDGREDLLVADNATTDLNLYRNDGDFAFTKIAVLTMPVGSAYEPLLLDVDRDGDLDIAALHLGGMTLFRNLGGFAFAADPTISVGGGLVLGVVADLFQNGRDEIAASASTAGSLSIFKNTAAAGLALQSTVPSGAQPLGVTAGDFDGDGEIDLATANFGDATVSIAGRAAQIFVPNATQLATDTAPVYVKSADLNRDGRTDLVVSHFAGNNLLTYFRTGYFQFGSPAATPTNGSPLGLVVTDIDGDGLEDVLYTESNTGRANVRLTQAVNGFFGPPVAAFPAQYAVLMPLLVDLDGDGLADLVTNTAFGGLISLQRNLSQ